MEPLTYRGDHSMVAFFPDYADPPFCVEVLPSTPVEMFGIQAPAGQENDDDLQTYILFYYCA